MSAPLPVSFSVLHDSVTETHFCGQLQALSIQLRPLSGFTNPITAKAVHMHKT